MHHPGLLSGSNLLAESEQSQNSQWAKTESQGTQVTSGALPMDIMDGEQGCG